jgi:hypothetical protein
LKFAGFLGENAVNKHIRGRPPSPLWYLLLLAPFVAMFWVPSYNRIEPTWGGVPFSTGISCYGSRLAPG